MCQNLRCRCEARRYDVRLVVAFDSRKTLLFALLQGGLVLTEAAVLRCGPNELQLRRSPRSWLF